MHELITYFCGGIIAALVILGLICCWVAITKQNDNYDNDFWG